MHDVFAIGNSVVLFYFDNDMNYNNIIFFYQIIFILSQGNDTYSCIPYEYLWLSSIVICIMNKKEILVKNWTTGLKIDDKCRSLISGNLLNEYLVTFHFRNVINYWLLIFNCCRVPSSIINFSLLLSRHTFLAHWEYTLIFIKKDDFQAQ